MQFDLDVPRTLDAQLSVVEQPAAVGIGRKGDAVIAAERTEPREARRIPALASGKESLKGLVDPPQNILAAREIRQRQAAIGAHRLQLVRLVIVVDRLAANPPRPDPLFKRSVVEAGRVPQLAVEKFHLGCGGYIRYLKAKRIHLYFRMKHQCLRGQNMHGSTKTKRERLSAVAEGRGLSSMDSVAVFTNLDGAEASQTCPVLGLYGHVMQLRVPKRVLIGSPVKVETDDILALGEVSCCRPESDGYVVSVDVLQALHDVSELSRLARALLA